LSTAIISDRVSIFERARCYYQLCKPNLSALVVITAVLGFYLASETIDWLRLVYLIAGTALTAAGACAMNMVLEKDLDADMRRTRNRPIPSGRLESGEATAFSLALFTTGFVYLAMFCGWWPAVLSLASALIYVALYTPLKRKGPIAIWVGAITGALPPVMGWSAVTGEIGFGGAVLFCILFAWQFPHFLALGFMYREDYQRAGFRFVASDPDRVGVQVAVGCVVCLVATLLPLPLGLLGPIYGWSAALLGGAFLFAGIRFARVPSPARARFAFFASITVLPVLLGLMVVDRLLG
jgi:protoheme IX farnesyltransferase